jgi:predicted DCC family thiol-disulfide oxidoreductase YuxK
MGLRQTFIRTYLSIDPRSLGLFRIVFALALLLDLYWRYLDVDFFYTNDGLLPNHTMLWAPPVRRMFSFFFMASTHAEATAGMAACGLVFLGLLLGYRTRTMQVLALLCVVSLNTRVCLLENGGDIVLNQLAVWSVFLPLGQRFSLDALLGSLRARSEHTAEQLADRSALRPPQQPVVSLAVLALILQLFVIYLFNALAKNGTTWSTGTAVQLALHQDRLVTALGVWLREHAPSALLSTFTHATRAIELLAAALVISPLWPAAARLLAIVLLPLLHVGFALCLDLGPFSYAMIAFVALLVHERHWAWLYSRLRARKKPLLCFFDADCGFCFLTVRVLARLDAYERIRFISNHEQSELPEGVSPELVERTVVVQEQGTARITTRSDAVAEICRALPFGFLAYAVLKLPGLRSLWLALYDRVAQNRTAISQWLGLAACGVPSVPVFAMPELPANGPARLRARALPVLNQALVAVVLVAATGETLSYNEAVPSFLHYPQPDALQAIIDYGRLIQSWRMFAPDAPEQDFMISVEATTVDGRLVDPYNEVASRYKRPPFRGIPSRLGNDQFFTTYSLVIPAEKSRPYWSAFEQWILSYHLRSKNPKDRITRYTVYLLSDLSPTSDKTAPRTPKKEAFMSYPRTP